MSQDDSRELTRNSTQGILVLHLAGSLELGDERLTWCVCGSVPRLVTLEGQANSKESRERRGALGVGPGDGTSRGVPKDGGEVRSLTESVRESYRKIV